MQINAPGLPQTLTPVVTADLRHWQVGQLLDARVIGQPRPNFTRLDIGGSQLDARGTLSAASGTLVRLRVEARAGSIVLKALDPPSPPTPTALTQAVARFLPRQAGMAETLTLLRQVQHTPAARDAAVTTTAPTATTAGALTPAAAMLASARSLLTALPQVGALQSPPALQQTIMAALVTPAAGGRSADAQTARPPSVDLRPLLAGLLRGLPPPTPDQRPQFGAITSANPAPPGSAPATSPGFAQTAADLPTAATIDAAIARVATLQLTNIAAATSAEVPFVVEFPVQFRDRIDLWRFELSVDDEPHGGSRAAPRANIRLTLQFDADTRITADLGSSGERVSVRLGASQPALEQLIARDLPQLEQALERRGVDLVAVSSGPLAPRAAVPRLAQHLIDDVI